MKQKQIFGFPQNVFVLSMVSFLNDIGGETIKNALPLFLANALGVNSTVIGAIEGITEATPQLLQPVSGFISDRFRKRKILIIAGQVLRTSMLFLFTATNWYQALLFRFLDRTGKGITNAPRDALVAASADHKKRGAAFGLNRAFDNGGAVVGLLMASVILGAGGVQAVMSRALFQQIVVLAAIPLCLAVVIIAVGVKDVEAVGAKHEFHFHDAFGKPFYVFLFFSFLFTLGNSSNAFLLLKAQQVGIGLSQLFLLLALYTLVPAIIGYPLSRLSDTIGRKRLLVGGWFLYAVTYFLFAGAQTIQLVVGLFLLYGLYYAMTEGAAKALVSDMVPESRRGTAFGLYNMVVGITLLPASLIAGYLWQTMGPSATFMFGGVMALVGTLGIFIVL